MCRVVCRVCGTGERRAGRGGTGAWNTTSDSVSHEHNRVMLPVLLPKPPTLTVVLSAVHRPRGRGPSWTCPPCPPAVSSLCPVRFIRVTRRSHRPRSPLPLLSSRPCSELSQSLPEHTAHYSSVCSSRLLSHLPQAAQHPGHHAVFRRLHLFASLLDGTKNFFAREGFRLTT